MLQEEQVLNGRYQLKQKLGQNAGRQTWLAEDLQTQTAEKVIVKLLAFGGEVQWDDLKLFEREAQILKHLNHPQIPKYRDYFSLDDRTLWFGLVQEYLPGSSLKDLLVLGKRFTEKEVRQIAESVLNILIYLHELHPPLLHRDIKPSNLIMSEDNRIYLVDFGAVQDKAAAEGATFTVVGTYGYAPMEQFGGRTVPASDLYALGATLIHLLTGTPPADLPQREMRIDFADRTSASCGFVQWIEKLTEPSLEKRFTKAKQALEALKSGRTNTSMKKVSPPFACRILSTKSSRWLYLKLPRRKLSFSENVGLGLKVVGMVFLGILLLAVSLSALIINSSFGIVFYSLIWVSWYLLISRIFLNNFTHQRITFEENLFIIEKWLFNHRFSSEKGYISEIQDVFQSVQITPGNSFKKGKEEEMVTIQTNSRRHSFGLGLTAMECLWLAHEIKDWLNSR